MKRLSLSELALVCSPLVFIALGAIALRARQRLSPPLNPNAKIILRVALSPTSAGATTGNLITFARTINASNSPQEGITIRYDERIVAKGHGNSQIIWGTVPNPSPPYLTSWFHGSGSGGWSRGRTSATSRFDGEAIELPVWTTQLEWQGEVGAAPRERGGDSRAGSSAVVRALSQIRGGAYLKKNLPIALNPSELDHIQKFQLEPVSSADIVSNAKSLGLDTCVKFEFKNSKSRIFRQAVAFDGKTRRILWSEGADVFHPYGYSEQAHVVGSYPRASDVLLLRLRKVPSSWGKITLFFNIAFDPKLNAGTDWKSCDEATFGKLKSQGWLTFSRRLVVRA